jgi:hypothetical protein
MPDFGSFRGFGEKLVQGQTPTQLGLIGTQDFSPALLDTYANAAAAYSLRLLRTLYTGSAIRVRRSSDNAEQDIGFVNNVVDTSALTNFCSGTDGFVTTWYDQSGNARNATQTTAASQPQIVSSGSVILDTGKPCISSTVGLLQLNATWGVALSNPQIFYVMKITGPVGYSGHWIYLGNTGGNNHFISDTGDAGSYTDIFNNSRPKYGSFNASLNQRYLECYENVGSTTTRFLNGVDRGSNLFTTVTPTNLNIGGRGILAFAAAGTIQEIVIYSTGNSSNRSGIQTDINNYYNVY